MDKIDLPVPVSFEFFPPNTPVGSEKLKTVVQELARSQPEFFSVTYGAGGSTREKTLATVQRHRRDGPRGRAAPVVRRLARAKASPRSWPPTARRTSTASWRCAATCPAAPRRRATSATRASWSRSSARRRASDWFIEVAAYPEYHPQQRYAAARPASTSPTR